VIVVEVRNAITVDVEHWFNRPVLSKHLGSTEVNAGHTVNSVRITLDLLKEYNRRATFFVLGEVAEAVPQVVEEIVDHGHEVALHGYSHTRLKERGQARFEEDLEKGIRLLQGLANENIRGFRAPEFSLNKESAWALKALVNHGVTYDSSMFPAYTMQYGSFKTPYYPYYPSLSDPNLVDPSQNRIKELPLLTRSLSKLRIPAAGGFYLRLFGHDFICKSVRKMNKRGHPAVLYVHNWEVSGFPRLDLPIQKKTYAYYRIPCLEEFRSLVRNVDSTILRELI